MDDEYGDDADFAALATNVVRPPVTSSSKTGDTRSTIPQTANGTTKIQQPTPQVLPARSAPSAILVAARQKGNPLLSHIRSLPWEFSDIPSDYVLGATTCALFLSLKYHRLHPEYIYSRIKALGHNYNLRILLALVDIHNHEESLKELSKTSLINNLTMILCWSAQEAGRYVELYKSYEHASPASIKAHQATTYAEKLVEFITIPRSINKTDAFSLVSSFGSVRGAVNARPEEIAEITGWGERKVQNWCHAVRENFRVKKAARRGPHGVDKEPSRMALLRQQSTSNTSPHLSSVDTSAKHAALISSEDIVHHNGQGQQTNREAPERSKETSADDLPMWEPSVDDEEGLENVSKPIIDPSLTATEQSRPIMQNVTKQSPLNARPTETLKDGVAAALAKLREQ